MEESSAYEWLSRLYTNIPKSGLGYKLNPGPLWWEVNELATINFHGLTSNLQNLYLFPCFYTKKNLIYFINLLLSEHIL